MKQVIFILAITSMLITGGIFTSCQSTDKKVDDAQSNVEDAKKELKDARNDAEAQKAAFAEEWKLFRSEADAKIAANEKQIAELKEKIKTSGKKLDALYVKSIDELEQKNKDLKTKIESYDKSQSDWATFKREFNHDMDGLGQAFKDLVVNNKK